MPDLIIAIILGVVEGVTEFLPVSSTGHLLLCEKWMGMDLKDGFWNTFTIFIQIGAIAAVVVYFRERILGLLTGRRERTLTPLEISQSASLGAGGEPKVAPDAPADELADDTPPTAAQRGYAILMIMLASTPLVIAFFAQKWAEKHMESPVVVALALALGGVAIIAIEWLPLHVTTRRIERISWKQALGIGFAQVLAAVFPGTSRSAATIMAGMVGGGGRPGGAGVRLFPCTP